MSTPSKETSKITIDIPIETKRKLERMKLLKGIPQKDVVSRAIVEGVDERYGEIIGKKEKGDEQLTPTRLSAKDRPS